MTFHTRLASCGLTVGIRLMVRDTVAVETRARFAISRMSIRRVKTLCCLLRLELNDNTKAGQSFTQDEAWTRSQRTCLAPKLLPLDRLSHWIFSENSLCIAQEGGV